MLTPWLPSPSLTWDILSIPDMMLHSPLYLPEPWTGKKKVLKKSKKKKSHPTLLVFSAWSGEACMQPEEGWRDKCAAHFFVKSLPVLSKVVPTSIWSCSRLCVVLNHWQYLFQRLSLYNIYCPQTLIQGYDLFSEGSVSYILAFSLAWWSGPSGVF